MKKKEQNKGQSLVVPILLGMVIILLGVVIALIVFKEPEKEILYHDSSSSEVDNTLDNSSNDNSTNNYITKEEALNIALKNINISRNNIYDVNVELDFKYNTTVYEIDFNYKNYEYEFYINATSGKILHSFRERD